MVEKKLNLDVAAVGVFCEVSRLESVGLRRPRSGEALREVSKETMDSLSSMGTPTAIGTELPLNQPASPPLDLSAILICPSLSPVNEGIKSSFSLTGDRGGDIERIPVSFRDARNGNIAVKAR